MINNNKRAIIRDKMKYYSTQEKVIEYRNYAKVHPLNGTLSVEHTALPPVGWMNQPYVFTEDLLKIFNVYNQVLLEKDSKKKSKSKGKGKGRG